MDEPKMTLGHPNRTPLCFGMLPNSASFEIYTSDFPSKFMQKSKNEKNSTKIIKGMYDSYSFYNKKE